jgi:BlaI family penicillinase repressor
MEAPNITESEWHLMEILWERSPRSASEMARELKEATGWAENTVRTLLTRLIDKGAVVACEDDDGGRARRFRPAMRREDCVKAESESFLARIFQGAAKPLLIHFARDARLTSEEVKELKKLLDQSVHNER